MIVKFLLSLSTILHGEFWLLNSLHEDLFVAELLQSELFVAELSTGCMTCL